MIPAGGIFKIILASAAIACALEPVAPVTPPHSAVSLGAVASLYDDVYSGDANLSGEAALNPRLSVWGATSYRFISYQYELMMHDQLHEYVNLRVSGLNATHIGFKYFPLEFFGFGSSWRFRSHGGDIKEHYDRLGASLMGLYPVSPKLRLGAALDAFTYFERLEYQPGKELGGRLSFVWKPAKWEVSEVLMYRRRMDESRNLRMDGPYRGMDDEYSGIKARIAVSRVFWSDVFPLSIGAAYEMSKGTLFGFETGHLVEIFTQKAF